MVYMQYIKIKMLINLPMWWKFKKLFFIKKSYIQRSFFLKFNDKTWVLYFVCSVLAFICIYIKKIILGGKNLY
jgi:hypothetical protein